MSLDGKNILITGAGVRVGRSLALAVARLGANVILHFGRSQREAARTAAEVQRMGSQVMSLQADLNDPAQVATVIEHAAAFGPLYALINYASIFESLDWQSTRLEDRKRHLMINLTAPFLLSVVRVLDVESGASRLMTTRGNSTALEASRDGRWLFFVHDRVDAPPELFRMATAGGEPKRVTALNAGLAAVSLLVGLLVLELGLRLLAGGARGGKEQRERNRYTEYDPVLGWRKTPGAHVVYKRRDFHVEFDVNSLGLRGPERPYAKPPGVLRVLSLGDSFLEAFTVSDPETVTARLEQHFAQRGCRADAAMGVPVREHPESTRATRSE